MADCCKETVAGFKAAVAKVYTASASACTESAAAATIAGTKAECSSTAAATIASASCCEKGASAATTASAGSGCDKSASAAAIAGNKSECSKDATAALTYAAIKQRAGRRVVLSGNAVCGKCTYEVTESCEALFATADGKVYRLMKNAHVDKMRKADVENGFEITTRVREVDGVKYLEIQNIKAL
jgi:hypothetical protein